jgi:hypothetical protein
VVGERDRERYERIAGALAGVGVKDFLILGLRKTRSCGPDELECFSVLSTKDLEMFVATLKNNILQNNLELVELLAKMLQHAVHNELNETLQQINFPISILHEAKA